MIEKIVEEAKHPDYVGSEGKRLRDEAQAMDNEAARAIWDHRNHESKLKMDFHGLRVKEAMDRFEEELGSLLGEEKSDRVLEVIPGAGHHSKGGESNAKLKP